MTRATFLPLNFVFAVMLGRFKPKLDVYKENTSHILRYFGEIFAYSTLFY